MSNQRKFLLEMKRLGLLDVIREITLKDKPFQASLAGWAESEAKIQFLFDLMDLGLPVGKKLMFLNPQQQQRVREITLDMDSAAAEAYVAALKQPGKVFDQGKLIQEFGLVGPEIRTLTVVAQELLLADPALVTNASRLEAKIRERMAQSKTAGSPLPKEELKRFRIGFGQPSGAGYRPNDTGTLPKALAKKLERGGFIQALPFSDRRKMEWGKEVGLVSVTCLLTEKGSKVLNDYWAVLNGKTAGPVAHRVAARWVARQR